ncbi:MAG: hypothetical protein U0836_01900 [Pirellulales bacterium]
MGRDLGEELSLDNALRSSQTTDGQRPRYEVCAVEGGREGKGGAAHEQEGTAVVP